jgi:predicted nucleic acid-binding protein
MVVVDASVLANALVYADARLARTATRYCTIHLVE